MVTLQQVTSYLDGVLDHSAYQDRSLNGLQVEASQEVTTVAYAVDAGLSVLEKAVDAGADLIIVHHGMFWGEEKPIRGALAKKLSLLFSRGCSLYAAHIPLDAHPTLGNNALLAQYLGAEALEPFCRHRGALIGMKGRFPSSLTMGMIEEKARQLVGHTHSLSLPFGKKEIHTVGVVTGAGSFAIQACLDAGLDLLVTGEPKQEAYHAAKEEELNVLFAGHYATETFGVKALAEVLASHFKLNTVFINEETGI